MQHIETYNYSTDVKRIGGRIGSQRYRECFENTIEETVNRYEILHLVKRVGKEAGFTPRMIQLLDYYINFTRDIDWEEGGQPVVYQSLAKTALDLGVNERQIQRLEKALADVNAITWKDSGNHKRYGQRCEQTGAIIYAYGVDLTPLAALKADLEAKFFEKQAHDRAWMETKRQISYYRSQIRAGIAEATEQDDERAGQWSIAYEDIAVQIRTNINLENLNKLLEAHKALQTTIYEGLTRYNAVKETKETTCSDAQKDAHYKYPKNKISNKLESNISVLNSSNECSNADEHCETEETLVPKTQAETKPVDILRSAGLQHITLKQAVSASSQRLKNYLPLEEGELTWGDFIEAAFRLKNELDISQTSWGRGCEVLGTSGAALCVILADHSTQRLFNPIENANAYFCAMIDRAKRGELKLHNSIFGILKSGGEVKSC
ncbi:MAG: hypothetical protein CL561_13005 [Alphaproteobacteria bacterium]|nr:hypothetical protein [Alphaproteobacteria bacterium]|tara:strand:+ start:32844 stop:34148 length:1305 start_codon:yes stop_codon:yes gene_type:complete